MVSAVGIEPTTYKAKILEGLDRHSDEGVMKAHWSDEDIAHWRVNRFHSTRQTSNSSALDCLAGWRN